MEQVFSVDTNAAGSAEQPLVADVQAGAGEENTISAAEILAEGTTQERAEENTVEQVPPVATGEPSQADAAPPPKTYTQSEFDEAVRQRAGHIQRGMEQKLQQDPYYLAGKRLAEMQAMADGVTPEMAVQRVLNEGIERQVQAMSEDPRMLARAVLGNQMGMAPSASSQQPPPQQPPISPEAELQAKALSIVREIDECMQSGELPRDFNLQATLKVYPNFVAASAKHGVRAAFDTVRELRSRQAQQQQTLQRAAVNNALPRAIRPGNVQEDGPIDYGKLTTEQFARLKERMWEEYASGKTVRIT